jgi:hypothetical protein
VGEGRGVKGERKKARDKRINTKYKGIMKTFYFMFKYKCI